MGFFTSTFEYWAFELSLYSECPNTGRPVWQTRRKNVWLKNVQFISFGLYFFRSVASLDRYICVCVCVYI